jgi:dTDP-4-dehydrorhamnose reductase
VILLFGGNGQLGRELTRASSARAIPLAALSHSEAAIDDEAAVRDAVGRYSPAVVVNAAAYTKVDLAERETDAARRANEIGPGILAAACATAGVPLIHISTDFVFDGSKQDAYVEDDPVDPINAYGRSKAAGERAVRETAPAHVIIRTSWVYGEFGHNFLKTMLTLASTRDELRVVSDQRGCPTSTSDLAAAILTVALRLAAGDDVSGTYHFAGSGVTTWHGFAARIVAAQAPLTGRAPRVTAISTKDYPTAARRPANSALDCSRFERVFGIRGLPWQEETDRITRALASANQGTRPHVA